MMYCTKHSELIDSTYETCPKCEAEAQDVAVRALRDELRAAQREVEKMHAYLDRLNIPRLDEHIQVSVANRVSEVCAIAEVAQGQLAAAQAGRNALSPEVLAFAQSMERRLRANDHKPGWKSDTPVALMDRLRDELRELAVAVIAREGGDGSPKLMTTQVLKEAADVANFAMMVADVSDAL